MCTASLHDTVRNSRWTSQSRIKRPWDAIRGLAAVEAEGWAGERTAILEMSGMIGFCFIYHNLEYEQHIQLLEYTALRSLTFYYVCHRAVLL